MYERKVAHFAYSVDRNTSGVTIAHLQVSDGFVADPYPTDLIHNLSPEIVVLCR